MANPPAKFCRSCGRSFEWRKKWADDWEQVRYCSSRCRGRGLLDVDREMEQVILDLLDQRASGATICPSEAAKAVALRRDLGGEEWRTLMEPARAAARRLVVADRLDITQRGRVVDPSTAKGPIRLRLRSSG